MHSRRRFRRRARGFRHRVHVALLRPDARRRTSATTRPGRRRRPSASRTPTSPPPRGFRPPGRATTSGTTSRSRTTRWSTATSRHPGLLAPHERRQGAGDGRRVHVRRGRRQRRGRRSPDRLVLELRRRPRLVHGHRPHAGDLLRAGRAQAPARWPEDGGQGRRRRLRRRAPAHAEPPTTSRSTTLAKGADKTGEPIAHGRAAGPPRPAHLARRPRLADDAERDHVAGRHDPRLLARRGRPAGHRGRPRLRDQPLGLPLLRAAAGHARRRRAGQRRRRRASTPYKGHNQLSRFKLDRRRTRSTWRPSRRSSRSRPTAGMCCHVGGDIDFDAQGNLYLSTGDDTNPFAVRRLHADRRARARATRPSTPSAASANTNDLRGKLLRIKVARGRHLHDPGGQPVRARHGWGPGPRSTRWASATRSASRSTATTGWVYLGDYGPDAGGANPTRGPGGQVEFNLIKAPGNYGWPYCHGRQRRLQRLRLRHRRRPARSSTAPRPKNNSPRNTGLVDLPPAQPGLDRLRRLQRARVRLRLRVADGRPGLPLRRRPTRRRPSSPRTSTARTSPTSSAAAGSSTIDGRHRRATLPGDRASFMDSFDCKQLIDMEFGPDGALYVLDYGTGYFTGDANSALYRIDYVQGTRTPDRRVRTADKTSGPAPLTVEFSADGLAPTRTAARSPTRGTSRRRRRPTRPAITRRTRTRTAGRYTATLTVTDPPARRPRVGEHHRRQHRADGQDHVPGRRARSTTTATRSRTRSRSPTPRTGRSTAPRSASTPRSATTSTRTATRADRLLRHDHDPAAWEDKTQHTFYVLNASYTDATQPGLELTGSDQVVLEWQHAAGRVLRRAERHAERRPPRRRRRRARRLHRRRATGCASTTST